MLLDSARAAAFAVGALAFYCAFFMYEDERGRLVNRVEQLWMAINDNKKRTGRTTPAVLNKVAVIVKRVLDRLLGRKLFSLQLIGVSLCYALSALFLGAAALFEWLHFRLVHIGSIPPNLPPNVLQLLSLAAKGLGVVGAVFMIFAVLPAIKRSGTTIVLSLVPPLLVLAGSVKLVILGRSTPAAGLIIGLMLSLASDVVLLALVRATIRRLATESRLSVLMLSIIGQVAALGILIVLPFEASGFLLVRYGSSSALQGFATLAIFNLFTAIASSMFLLVLIFVLAHRALWPLMDRVVYPVAARRMLADPKIMAALGTTCMGVASPLVWSLLKAIALWAGRLAS